MDIRVQGLKGGGEKKEMMYFVQIVKFCIFTASSMWLSWGKEQQERDFFKKSKK